MAPIRRYLRITRYSVLECRIYLDNPALAHSWLLHPRDPVLPRVIEAVRPYVLPKLREERERSRKKSTKKRGIKDTVTEDDFEVSIFLTETSTRHSLLYKHKHFRDTTQTKLTSNSARLTGASREAPIDVDGQVPQAAGGATGGDTPPPPPVLREEEDDDDDVVALHDIPTVPQDETATGADPAPPATSPRVSKRRRGRGGTLPGGDDGGGGQHHYAYVPGSDDDDDDDDDDDGLFVSEEDEDETAPPPAKRRRDDASADEVHQGGRDDKKKLAMDISYEGFAIYGRVLCLVVKRRAGSGGSKGKGVATAAGARGTAGQSAVPGGQAMMENWITSTQMPDAAVDGMLDAS